MRRERICTGRMIKRRSPGKRSAPGALPRRRGCGLRPYPGYQSETSSRQGEPWPTMASNAQSIVDANPSDLAGSKDWSGGIFCFDGQPGFRFVPSGLRCAEGVRATMPAAESARQSRHLHSFRWMRMPRKVRAPQGTVPGNAWAARADGKCNRKIPPNGSRVHLPDVSPAKWTSPPKGGRNAWQG